jgi:hypothetical protein
MGIVLPTLASAFAAFCVWLGVRIFNRRERWAKWTAVGMVVMLVYPLGFGPACWISSRTDTGAGPVAFVYQPVIRIIFEPSAPDSVVTAIEKYAELLSAPGWMFSASGDPDHVVGDGHSTYRCHWGVVL